MSLSTVVSYTFSLIGPGLWAVDFSEVFAGVIMPIIFLLNFGIFGGMHLGGTPVICRIGSQRQQGELNCIAFKHANLVLCKLPIYCGLLHHK